MSRRTSLRHASVMLRCMSVCRELERRLLDQSSYLTRLGFNYRKPLLDLRRSINLLRGELKLRERKGDCRTAVQGRRQACHAANL